MNVELAPAIQRYVKASNQHDMESILACFSDDALIHDEGETLQGKKAIESWIVKTIEKYKFQFKPLGVKDEEPEVVVAIEVSGTFRASPVTLDYHFKIGNDRIDSLAID